MQYFLTSVALVASATMAFAAPADVHSREAFSIKQVERGHVFKSGPLSMMKTYRKYAKVGASAPADVRSAAAAAAQSGEVSASPTQYDSSYLCPVSAGGQTLHLDFDTGSSDLWVFSTLQPSSEVDGQDQYNPSRSSTAQLLNGYSWQISYGDGSGASGVVYADKVVVGGVTATSQAVEAATSVSSEFTDDTTTDGLLGLAFSSINTVQPQQQTTFFDTVSSSLASPLFTATLKKGAPGTYDFGYLDSSKYKGSIYYTSVDNSQGFWQFTAGTYAVGSGSYSSSSIGTAIADTGTTLMYVPNAAVKAYYAKVSGSSYSSSQGGYVFPCSATLPSFTVKIGSGSFTVPGTYINYAPTSSSGKTCFGGIQSNTGIGMSILGDIFLKSVYAVFDQTQSSPRLGFAAQA